MKKKLVSINRDNHNLMKIKYLLSLNGEINVCQKKKVKSGIMDIHSKVKNIRIRYCAVREHLQQEINAIWLLEITFTRKVQLSRAIERENVKDLHVYSCIKAEQSCK